MFRLAEEAASRTNNVSGLPDYNAALKAYDTAAKYLGINLEHRVTLSGSVKLEDVEALARRLEKS